MSLFNFKVKTIYIHIENNYRTLFMPNFSVNCWAVFELSLSKDGHPQNVSERVDKVVSNDVMSDTNYLGERVDNVIPKENLFYNPHKWWFNLNRAPPWKRKFDASNVNKNWSPLSICPTSAHTTILLWVRKKHRDTSCLEANKEWKAFQNAKLPYIFAYSIIVRFKVS